MVNDGALRTSLVWLAVVMVVVGIWSLSLKKVLVTYLVGMAGIGGVLLPDWDFFDRDYSRWVHTVTDQDKAILAQRSTFRKRITPLRVVAYTTIYGYGFYKCGCLCPIEQELTPLFFTFYYTTISFTTLLLPS